MDNYLPDVKLEALDEKGFLSFLEGIGSEKKAEFDKKIIRSSLKIHGITSKQINDIYKYFHKNGYSNILSFSNKISYEITMLRGRLVLNDKSLDINKKIDFLNAWIQNVDTWALTDGVFANYKLKSEDKQALLSFAESLVSRSLEFEIRLGVIILLDYFLTDEDIDNTFRILSDIKYGEYYYVDMAVAWLCATALIDFEGKTLAFLNSPFINDFTYKKSLQKARESFRIPDEKKIFYKSLLDAKKSS